MNNYQFILGSKSPRRKQLFTDAGFEFEIENFDADESFPDNLNPELVAEYIALKKAAFYEKPLGNKILICADTTVVINNEVLNKPADFNEAKSMLEKLNNNWHKVITGVCIKSDSFIHSFSECTEVKFAAFNQEEIEYYINNFKPYDKAGAYGAQDWLGLCKIEAFKGCFYNVVGFPMSRFYKELKPFEEVI